MRKTHKQKRRELKLPKTKRLSRGLYCFWIGKKQYEVETGLAATGYGLSCTVPIWDLFLLTKRGEREWINDFGSKKEAVHHAVCLG